MASRRLEDLHPQLQLRAREFVNRCDARGVPVLIICTYRPDEEQAELYARGRTKPGRIATWAKPGESLHNVTLGRARIPAARAFDFVPLRLGKLVWGTAGNGIDDDPTDDDRDDLELWERCGVIGEGLGLEWAGRWSPNKREFPHLQLPPR